MLLVILKTVIIIILILLAIILAIVGILEGIGLLILCIQDFAKLFKPLD